MNNIHKLIRFPNRIPVQDITALRKILGKADYDYAILLGKDKAADGYAREYYWSSISSDTDNGDTIIKPAVVDGSHQGRWLIVPRQNNVPRTLSFIIEGNNSQVTWNQHHGLGTRNWIIQVVQVGGTGNTYDTVVETDIKLYDDSISITFYQIVPATGEKYKIMATEIITT